MYVCSNHAYLSRASYVIFFQQYENLNQDIYSVTDIMVLECHYDSRAPELSDLNSGHDRSLFKVAYILSYYVTITLFMQGILNRSHSQVMFVLLLPVTIQSPCRHGMLYFCIVLRQLSLAYYGGLVWDDIIDLKLHVNQPSQSIYGFIKFSGNHASSSEESN